MPKKKRAPEPEPEPDAAEAPAEIVKLRHVEEPGFVFGDGSRYVGEVRQVTVGGGDPAVQRHGSGRAFGTTGALEFEGRWEADEMREGTWTAPSGAAYEGQFAGGMFHGRGSYTWSDGATYVGEFRENKMHGRGTYTASDGARFPTVGEGSFVNGAYDSGEVQVHLR